MTAGARALIRIFWPLSGRAADRTRPMTPDFEEPYTGATGKGYIPALDAVQTINPFEEHGLLPARFFRK